MIGAGIIVDKVIKILAKQFKFDKVLDYVEKDNPLDKKVKKMETPGFYVSKREDQIGFRVFFPNGYGISVIFGGDSGSNQVLVNKSDSSTDYFWSDAYK